MIGSNQHVYVACEVGWDLPGTVWWCLQMISVIGWPARAALLLGRLRRKPVEERMNDGLWPLFWTGCVLYISCSGSWYPLRLPGVAQTILGVGSLPLAISCHSNGYEFLCRTMGANIEPTKYLPGGETVARDAYGRLINWRWLKKLASAILFGALLLGSIWDRTCNTDPNSIDSCAVWRLGTIDMIYSGAFHSRLSTGVSAPVDPDELRAMVSSKMCLSPEVKASFASHRPSVRFNSTDVLTQRY